MCGAKLPKQFIEDLGKDESEEGQFEIGVEFAAKQTRELISAGVAGLHFYVLNRSNATSRILEAVEL